MTSFFPKDIRTSSRQWFKPMPLALGPHLGTRRQTSKWTWFAEKVFNCQICCTDPCNHSWLTLFRQRMHFVIAWRARGWQDEYRRSVIKGL